MIPRVSASHALVISVTIISLAILGSVRALFPSMQTDEGPYAAVALRILNGDLFLNHFPFDKLLFAPYVMVPGVLMAGEPPFRCDRRGLIAAISGSVAMQGLIKDVSGSSRLAFVPQFTYPVINLSPFM